VSVRSTLVAPLRRLLFAVNIGALRLTLRLTKHSHVRGLPVADFAPSGTFESACPKVGDALELIDYYDPCRSRRLRREFKYVILARTRISAVAEYWHSLRACVLDVDFVTANTSAVVATLIVHEATHARLHRAGVRSDRYRIEHCCVSQEIAFAERLPEPGRSALVAWAQAKRVDSDFWSETAFLTRARERLLTTRAPAWMVRLFGK
jgi:hypothetical protein